jgi:uncharacterized protein DUF4339
VGGSAAKQNCSTFLSTVFNRFVDYFVLIDEKERGPYTEVQLRSMWLAGSLTGEMPYRQADSQQWSPLSDMRYQLESAAKIQESAAKIQAERIAKTVQPETRGSMVVYVLLAFLLPIVGLIIGIVLLPQPGKKPQGVLLIILSGVGFYGWLSLWPSIFG